MDLQQAKVLLDKINSLFRNINMDGSGITSIEKDLMMSYIRQYYELFAAADPSSKSFSDTSNLALNSRPASNKVAEKPAPQKRNYVPPRIIEIPDSLKELENEKEPEPAIVAPRQVQKQAPPPPPPPPAPKQERVIATPSEFDPLFEFKAATELSEKLSERPVKDLTRALAINDRLLYMNELFGRDQNALNNALELLNKYESLQQAKGLLINIAEQFDWLDPAKLEIARSFVKLVRRRYL